MKMMSRTNMTSTIGVTLISAMTGRRRCRLPASAAVPPFIAICVPLSPFVDLPRQDRGEFVGEPLQALDLLIHVRDELVIENRRGYGGDEADCGRKEGLREAIPRASGARIKEELLDRDRPDHYRCDEQPDHHQFDYQIGILEEIPD